MSLDSMDSGPSLSPDHTTDPTDPQKQAVATTNNTSPTTSHQLMTTSTAAAQSASSAALFNSSQTNLSLFELGKIYYERCDFDVAIENFETAALKARNQRDFETYLKSQSYLLRMYAERDDNESIHQTKEKLQDLVLKEGFELNSKTYYTLGICASYKNQHDIALDYFKKALGIAMSIDHKPDICYAISGLAITYYRLDRLHDALKEIYNLQIFFQVIPMPDIQLSSQILNAHILRKLKKYDEAIEVLWQCYDLLNKEKDMYIYFSLLLGLGITYKDANEVNLARMYLQLAHRSIDARNLTRTYKRLTHELEMLGVPNTAEYDLIFRSNSNTVAERKKGVIDFKNQFILLDMLRLFMKYPGQVQSKEALVRHVWRQDYDPSIHDNKIYVTIKRLRKLIEPDFDKPRYIFRAKNGYYLHKDTKVLLEH